MESQYKEKLKKKSELNKLLTAANYLLTTEQRVILVNTLSENNITVKMCDCCDKIVSVGYGINNDAKFICSDKCLAIAEITPATNIIEWKELGV